MAVTLAVPWDTSALAPKFLLSFLGSANQVFSDLLLLSSVPLLPSPVTPVDLSPFGFLDSGRVLV
jgi:hypothetical protein